MSASAARGAAAFGFAAAPAAAGVPIYFAIPEPWGSLLVFYLFLVAGALGGGSLARPGERGPVALRFGITFSIPAAVLPFSLLPADGPGIVVSTAAAWGFALAAGAGLGALLSAPRLARAPRSRLGVSLRASAAFLAGGALAGATGTVLVAILPGRGYFLAWGVAVIGGLASGGALFERTCR
jgi:hypothetical protein